MWSRLLQRSEQPANMEFSDIMNMASSNKYSGQELLKRKKDFKKTDSDGVSSSAIQSFLAKKQAEEQQKKDRETEEKRKRIEARLQQSAKAKTQKETAEAEKKKDATKKSEVIKSAAFVEDKPKHPRKKMERVSRVTEQNVSRIPVIEKTKKILADQIPSKEKTEESFPGKQKHSSKHSLKDTKHSASTSKSSSSSEKHKHKLKHTLNDTAHFSSSNSSKVSSSTSRSESPKTTSSEVVKKKKKLPKNQPPPMNIQDILKLASQNKGGIGSVIPKKKPVVKPKEESVVPRSDVMDYDIADMKRDKKNRNANRNSSAKNVKKDSQRSSITSVKKDLKSSSTASVKKDIKSSSTASVKKGLKSSSITKDLKLSSSGCVKKDSKISHSINNGKSKVFDSKQQGVDPRRERSVSKSDLLKRKMDDKRPATMKPRVNNPAPSVVRQTLDVRTSYDRPRPHEMYNRRNPFQRQPPPFSRKRKMYDEEDEEDEDLSDFIDDEVDGGAVNVSQCIQQIFGYNRNKYVDEDDDDLKGMEASYSQIAKEEQRSSKIAKLEDEIEHLKEIEMLKKEKKKLKKQAKGK